MEAYPEKLIIRSRVKLKPDDPTVVAEYVGSKRLIRVVAGPPEVKKLTSSDLLKLHHRLYQHRVMLPFAEWVIQSPETSDQYWTLFRYDKLVGGMARSTKPRDVVMVVEKEEEEEKKKEKKEEVEEDEEESGGDDDDNSAQVDVRKFPVDWDETQVKRWIGKYLNFPAPDQITHYRRYGDLYCFEFLCKWMVHAHLEPEQCWVQLVDLQKRYPTLLREKYGWDIREQVTRNFEEDDTRSISEKSVVCSEPDQPAYRARAEDVTVKKYGKKESRASKKAAKREKKDRGSDTSSSSSNSSAEPPHPPPRIIHPKPPTTTPYQSIFKQSTVHPRPRYLIRDMNGIVVR